MLLLLLLLNLCLCNVLYTWFKYTLHAARVDIWSVHINYTRIIYDRQQQQVNIDIDYILMAHLQFKDFDVE